MKAADREMIKNKFNGLCAYTGKPLGLDWQVDHLKPVVRKMKVIPSYYINTDTGQVTTMQDYANDIIGNIKKIPSRLANDGFRNPENNCIENCIPAVKIINHYKRDQDIETFRRFISTLHLRLKKLPKNTESSQTIRRKKYLYDVAELFGITVDKPFSGVFYFESITS